MTNIYVGNLSFRATEGDLRKAFSRFGVVAAVGIVMDSETGRSRGFAFVEMSDPAEAKLAIDGLNDQEIAGRRVSVTEGRPRTERPSGGGGRRGYGDNGGGRANEGGGGGAGRSYGDNSGGSRYGQGGGGGQRRGNSSRDRHDD